MDVTPNESVGIYGQEIRKLKSRPYIFYSWRINSDGGVGFSLDWSRKLIIGDLNTQSLKSIWNGKTLLNYRKMHLLRKGKIILSAAYSQLSHGLPDNIDPSAKLLIKRD